MARHSDIYVPPQLAVVETLSRIYGNPLAAPNSICYSWARDLRLRRGGETILYTGCLYQLMSYADSLVRMYERFGGFGLRISKIFSRKAPKLFSRIMSSLVKPNPEVLEYSSRTLRSIAQLLRSSGVDFGYLYEGDVYSGIYLYELGLEEEFVAHAIKVYRKFKEEGVRRIITVDPHTTYVLKEIYPRYIENFDIEVKHYLELVAMKRSAVDRDSLSGEAKDKPPVIHDSCYMVRKLGLYEAVRNAMRNVRFVEPRNTGVRTICCGGPIEGISPELSLRVAVRRARELALTGSNRVIVMCPICYTNLSRALKMLGYRNIMILDLSEEIASNSTAR